MSDTLFDTGVRLATEEQVRELVMFHYRAEVVRKWTYEKAGVKLNRLRKKAHRNAQHGAAVARDIDRADGVEPPLRGVTNAISRDMAADTLVQALRSSDPHEISDALADAAHRLDDDEARRVAGYLVKLFKGQA